MSKYVHENFCTVNFIIHYPLCPDQPNTHTHTELKSKSNALRVN